MTRMSPWKVTTDPMILRRVGKTGEELCEAGAVCCRIVIQGIDEIDPSSGKTNRQRLLEELADVQAQIHCTREALLADDDEFFDERTATKEANMDDWEGQMAEEVVVYKGGTDVGKSEGMHLRFVKETAFGVTPGLEIDSNRPFLGPTLGTLRMFPHNSQESPCGAHPCAPHGFNRSASHNEDRYVCDCEVWPTPAGCSGPDIDGDTCLDCPAR